MAMKIRVHELAKELGKDNKEIVDYLTAKGITGKTAVSLVPEAEVYRLREMYGEKKAEAPKAEPKTGAPAAGTGDGEKPEAPKKKTIIRVIRTQNASGRIPVRSQDKKAPEHRDIRRPVRPARDEHAPRTVIRPAPAPEAKDKTREETAVHAEPAAAAETVRKEDAVVPAPEKTAAAVTGIRTPETAPVESAAPAAEKTEALPEAEKTAAVKAEAETKPAETEQAAAPEKSEAAPKEKAAAEEKKVSEPKDAAPAKAEKPAAKEGKQPSQTAPAAEKKQDRRSPVNQDPRNVRTDLLRKSPEERAKLIAEYERKKQEQLARQMNQPKGRGAQGSRRGGGQPGRGNAPGGMRTGGPQGGNGQVRPAQQGSGRPGGNRQGAPAADNRDRAPRQSAEKKVYTIRHDVPADSALAHKTTRDFHGKDRDRQKNDRRGYEEQPAHGSQGRKFNKVPKALQNQKPKVEEVKKETITEITIPERITIRDLADKMKIQASQIIKSLFMKGEIVTVNHEIPFEKAEEIAMEYDIIAEMEEKEDVIGELLKEEDEDESDMTPRPPVVCVMGHVDHGKTSLLDAIRNTQVTAREAGGITQHIGAYMITVNGQRITFLDTPGHEAFTAMRMRGANSTDIAVLVVAADDGVMPQTVEAINHAKAAGVEIIVAINKIDKPAANIDRVKQELADYGLIPEEWGGPTIFCPVSAKTHEGLENLLEMILLAAEVKELKANPNRKARGIVLEAKLDRGRGPVATILVQKGTLRQGDFIACGASSGKVRAMTDDKGRQVKKATPSMPVEIIGLNAVPGAGEVLVALDSDKEAKAFAATFITENKKTLLEATQSQMSLDDLFSKIKEGNLKELPLIVKADVQGSVEAVSQSLLKLTNDEVVVKVIHGAVGNVSESDVNLAAASGALILGFNVKADATARSIAEQNNIEIRLYSVIYQVIDDVERALKGMRAAVYEEKILGHAVVRQIFKASGIGNIAGSYVTDGTFERKCKIRIRHQDKVIYEGDLASLKRFKDDVKEVREGYECGLVFDGFNDFEVDDTIEAYKMVEVEQ